MGMPAELYVNMSGIWSVISVVVVCGLRRDSGSCAHAQSLSSLVHESSLVFRNKNVF